MSRRRDMPSLVFCTKLQCQRTPPGPQDVNIRTSITQVHWVPLWACLCPGAPHPAPPWCFDEALCVVGKYQVMLFSHRNIKYSWHFPPWAARPPATFCLRWLLCLCARTSCRRYTACSSYCVWACPNVYQFFYDAETLCVKKRKLFHTHISSRPDWSRQWAILFHGLLCETSAPLYDIFPRIGCQSLLNAPEHDCPCVVDALPRNAVDLTLS